MYKTKEWTCFRTRNLYISLSRMDIEKNIFFLHTSIWAIVLLRHFQNKSGLDIKYGKIWPVPSQVGTSIPTFRDFYLHLLAGKCFHQQLLVWFSTTSSGADDWWPFF